MFRVPEWAEEKGLDYAYCGGNFGNTFDINPFMAG